MDLRAKVARILSKAVTRQTPFESISLYDRTRLDHLAQAAIDTVFAELRNVTLGMWGAAWAVTG